MNPHNSPSTPSEPDPTGTTPDDSSSSQPSRRSLSRRRLLRWAGLGAGGAIVAGSGAVGVRAATNGVWGAGTRDSHELWRSWKDETGVRGVVAAGVLAASPHNTQPWLFDVRPSSIDVLSEPSRRIPITDASLREHYSGLGCAVENMVRAAGALGFSATVRVVPEGTDSPVVARLELESGAAQDDPLYEAIGGRHTNRGPYLDREVPEAELSRLEELAGAHEGVGLRWLTSRADRDEMSSLIVEATQAITDDEEQSRDSASWFRTPRSDVDHHRDGITLDAQALDPFTLAMAKILPEQSRQAADRFWVDRTRSEQCPTAAAYGVITVGDATALQDQFNGGRALQAVHLAATHAELGLHPMNQITERIDRDHALGQPDQFGSRYAALLGAEANTLLLAFRVGYPERAAMPSPRLRLDDVLT
ncbi:hypothetical protein [Nocardiopsis sp. B62]|uniref:Acg family FMN-binding oxidoreductase n=1 Tax=Nocardiopsis sp. B62 TaxID=2824874 RepID=UPI001FFCB328|nr:hypothetical protein [Nocardiopsis sp. B62]